MNHSLSFFDAKKIEHLANRASKKGIAEATRYLWKVARNSVKKTIGRQKKYDLKIFVGRYRLVGQSRVGTDGATIDYESGSYDAKTYLSSPNRSNEKIVQRDTKYDVKEPQKQGSYRVKPHSHAGQPPRTHKTDQPGWHDYWLKKSIRFDAKDGVVFVNPVRGGRTYGMSKPLPLLIEEGGTTVTAIKKLEGYYAIKKYYKGGNITVSYRPRYSQRVKRYHAKARPFLKPALVQAAEKLIQILKDSIKK